jgi:hypothetical protein
LGFGFALGAEVFDDPFEAGNGLGDSLFHQLLLGVNPFGTAGNPVVPGEIFRGHTRAIVVLLGGLANLFAVFAAAATGARAAEIFALHSPTRDGHLLFLSHEATHLTAIVATAMGTARTACAGRRIEGEESEDSVEAENHDVEVLVTHGLKAVITKLKLF